MRIIGITGTLGSGKSTLASIFKDAGVPVFDADQSVHELYAEEAVERVSAVFPEALSENRIDRKKLFTTLDADPAKIDALEAIVHPMVLRKQIDFLKNCLKKNVRLCLLDNPLMLERPLFNVADVIVVVSTKPALQKERALARASMTPQKFEKLATRQFSDLEKRRRAHYMIDSSGDRNEILTEARRLLAMLRTMGEKNHVEH